jgi:type I restriction enzyme S subunit
MGTVTKQENKVPQLRFPEFRDSWEDFKLGELGRVSMCKRVLKHQTNDKGDVPFYTIGTFGKTPISYITQDLYDAYTAKYPFPKQGDILISAAGTIGRLVVYDGEPAYFQDSNIVWIDNDERKVINEFLLYCYRNIRWKTEDTTIARLYNDNLKNTKSSAPSQPTEQQKIADFLGSVDAWLDNLRSQKTALETYKRGMMQKLFTQQVRFKNNNGKDFEDWTELKAKQFVLNKKGAMKIGPFGSQLKKTSFVDEGFKVYGQENIFTNDFSYGQRFITEEHFNSLKSNEIHPGDFVISTMGTIGKCSLVPSGIQRGIMDSHMIRLQLNRDVVIPDYLSQIFASYDIQKQIKRLSVGGIMDGLSMGIINELRFPIPQSTMEQQKIADFLTAIDQTITAKAEEITKVECWKKGLMQKMFV